MSEENLNEAINNNIQARQREIAVGTLGSRLHLTIGKVAQLITDKDHGATIATITLQELVDVALNASGEEVDEPVVAASAPTPRRSTRGKKKTTSKKKSVKKPTPKKKTGRSAKSSTRSDAGKKKPRLNRDLGHKEVLAALKASKGPTALKDVVTATGLPDTQVRTFLKELAGLGKVSTIGKARATRYELA
jgi:hypothetical protein